MNAQEPKKKAEYRNTVYGSTAYGSAEYSGAADTGMAKPLHGGYAGEIPVRLDFSANLSPLGLPPCVRQAVRDSADAWERYPDPYCGRLRHLLAERIARRYRAETGDAESGRAAGGARMGGIENGADPADALFRRIVVGNGADDLIFRIVQALRPKKALLITPTFSEYENALRQSGCSVSFYDLKPENDFDLTQEVLAAITGEIDLLFLCNPNNPTGRLIDPALPGAIIRRCGACGVTLVMDECFLPFAADARERSLLRDLCGVSGSSPAAAGRGWETSRSGDGSAGFSAQGSQEAAFADVSAHVIVLRAFTKLFSMPGLRLGYCVCGSAETAARIRQSGQFWSVSAPALAAGEAVLNDPDGRNYVNRTRETISRERSFLEQGLREAGIVCIPSQANFILCRSDLPLYELLLREGILIRDCANFRGLGEGYCRIAVRTHAENAALIEALKVCGRKQNEGF